MRSPLLCPAAAASWALFAAFALDLLTLPASTGPLQVGARAALAALSFVVAFGCSLRLASARPSARPSLFPPAIVAAPFPPLRLVSGQRPQRMASQVTRAGSAP